jgi:hypothetical protein
MMPPCDRANFWDIAGIENTNTPNEVSENMEQFTKDQAHLYDIPLNVVPMSKASKRRRVSPS